MTKKRRTIRDTRTERLTSPEEISGRMDGSVKRHRKEKTSAKNSPSGPNEQGGAATPSISTSQETRSERSLRHKELFVGVTRDIKQCIESKVATKALPRGADKRSGTETLSKMESKRQEPLAWRAYTCVVVSQYPGR